MDTLQSLMTPQKHHPHKHRCGKYCSLYAIDREIFVCRNFRRVIWAYLSTIWDVCPSTVTLTGHAHRGLTNCQLFPLCHITSKYLSTIWDVYPTLPSPLPSGLICDQSRCWIHLPAHPEWSLCQRDQSRSGWEEQGSWDSFYLSGGLLFHSIRLPWLQMTVQCIYILLSVLGVSIKPKFLRNI